MKKILLSSVALLGFTAGALAADLPSRRAAPAPMMAAVPVFTWTGFYAGVNAGYGWSTDDSIVIGGVRYDLDDDGGFVGGAQVGYNVQFGAFVVGLEGDIQYADFGGDDRFSSDDWFGTVRARAGVAFDRALVYGTGGFAFADDANGWTLGGGVEYAFTNNISAKIEGLYINLDQDNVLGSYDAEFGVIRAGLNFRFGTY